MRTTITIDDALFEEAVELTGITETSALLRSGLETLVRLEHGRRLSALGGSDPGAEAAPRDRAAAA
ncbi:MAG: type II toxin-antitoxin system VapB family antitoxin [Leucobacter sp.]